jgi:hypothetical protein
MCLGCGILTSCKFNGITALNVPFLRRVICNRNIGQKTLETALA